MRVAVVSDIHGNRQALEAVLDAVEAAAADELWSLGDLVGYGADPDACVALIRRYATVSLAGNHDLAVRGDIPLDEFSPGAALAARWTRETIDPAALDWLRTLEPQQLDEAVGLYHASPRDPVWEYVLSPLQAELCFDVLRHRVACIGHSHIALAYTRGDGEPATGEKRGDGELLEIASGEWLLNPGSVGQPRDGDPRAAWLLLDTDAWTAAFHRTEYDVEAAAAAIRRARLPDSLADRLPHGQ
ncbi:metallophosphoesterase family protein [Conexibacter sp. JD483]|uniref:metallophosphoesterase family protein n=1 Tax=unclassified Conexibacter TaxID=2627773 RepID=UPI0027275BCC|nr:MULTISPECIES: metallophosphoesterase family protein [unclassified Conexibacter]MDO8188681.1 metallophosphoesterase family protein [Conexibacter sp. CPCC 205706]MDO8201547.1 metallophosphoesterase family protein [Conexibacter sp. CPCC 205762]MDR9372681.1 metallophosphoesterase family protein [Conexibacter sp. JD483]